MLWHNGLSFFLLSQHIVLLQVLVAVFMILLPDTLGKAMEHGSSTWAPSIFWETQMDFRIRSLQPCLVLAVAASGE